MAKIEDVKAMVEAGKAKLIPGLVQEALDEGSSAADILQSMIDSMGIIGDKFSAGEVFVPEMLMAAKAMSKGVEVLKPLLTGNAASSLGTCVIGTVQGDLHDIGKNLVSMMIESAGFKMIDLGVDVGAEKFINAVKENNDVNVVALSGLLTTTLLAMRETVQALKASGLTGFKVIVGGAPVSQEMADEIGADGFAPDAGSAAVKAKELASA
ncbi:putative cobalamin binding protein [Desulfosporosinus orientis DSM 765]|uniref:Putative cobalamin binding protein n=1 Tax=Desulfosporosinus orientis (strain ATCC 19365 / DSM 765 / NCIMB 8382 / VKM B-1628 / Singapore I) TaxID=768706 RepID=G7WH76_DESOD|nr:cobalamin-dependent protein [Desulfosporosinus orientis]AET69584.1 putative cobalamin binding protein [Desulfosporosinus orientis DSM 765]